MKTASVISTCVHTAVLLFAVLSFSGKTFDVTPAESLPVDLVSEKDFSQMTKGVKDAPKAPEQKLLVEKIDQQKPADEIKPKLTEKKELTITADKPADAAAQVTPDPIADKLKKEEQKQVAKEDPKQLPPKKPDKKQPKFDADKIAALLDKRDPQRNAATGEALNTMPAMGTPTGQAAKLSQSEIDALRARLMGLWSPPTGIKDPTELIVRVTIRLGRDGRLAAPPFAVTDSKSVAALASRDSAVRAVLTGQPFDMLKPEHYDNWQEIELTFDPRDMFRGNN